MQYIIQFCMIQLSAVKAAYQTHCDESDSPAKPKFRQGRKWPTVHTARNASWWNRIALLAVFIDHVIKIDVTPAAAVVVHQSELRLFTVMSGHVPVPLFHGLPATARSLENRNLVDQQFSIHGVSVTASADQERQLSPHDPECR